jgi:IMP dehydrogenase/GMP reductase
VNFKWQIASEDAHQTRKHKLAKTVILEGGSALIISLAVLIGVMFWGSAEQSALASNIFGKLFIGVGGYGVLSAAVIMIRKLIDDQTRNN